MAVFFFPLPDTAHEFFTSKLLACDSFGGEAAFHQHFRGDSCVIGARKEQRVVAVHAMPARCRVDHGVVEHVADVQGSGNGAAHGERKSRTRRGWYVFSNSMGSYQLARGDI